MDQLIKKIVIRLIFFGFILVSQSALSNALKAEILKTWTLPSDFKINNKKIGGLSGCTLFDDKVYFVTDDRGSNGGPRIISFYFDKKDNEFNFNKSAVLKINPDNQKKILDLEGIGMISTDLFLLSSEGDLNQKPRIMPEIFWSDHLGNKTAAIQFPKEFLPEKSGKQTMGIQTNLAFEGLVVDLELKKWAAILEAPLLQGPKELKLIESDINSKNFDQIYSYPVPEDLNPENISGYFGATDILFLDESRYLILERGVQASFQGISFQTQLCTATKNNVKNNLKDQSKNEKNQLRRECFYSMNKDATLTSQFPNGANFEGLCWVNKQKKLFLTVSDNNFSKNEKTVLILYQLH